jgi:hypothetical protein
MYEWTSELEQMNWAQIYFYYFFEIFLTVDFFIDFFETF